MPQLARIFNFPITALLALGTLTAILTSPLVMSQKTTRTLSSADYANGQKRAADAARRVTPTLNKKLAEKHLQLGNPVFLRIFKQQRTLELWMQPNPHQPFILFHTYPIAAMSGNLGPKLAEGDRQAPEGFYAVSRRSMNPQSRFHLSFNLGYPNRYDRAHHRTGSALMVHGNRVSIGCFAMTDPKIEEIYTLCDSALRHGQAYFRVHSFPFPLTTENLASHHGQRWHAFWKELQPGFLYFQKNKRPPNIIVKDSKYQLTNPP